MSRVPTDAAQEFGVHSKRYYQLEVSYFKSRLDNHLFDLLWNKYWASKQGGWVALVPFIRAQHCQPLRGSWVGPADGKPEGGTRALAPQVTTLSSSPLVSNRDFVAAQLADLARKIEDANSTFGVKGERGTARAAAAAVVARARHPAAAVRRGLVAALPPSRCCWGPRQSTPASATAGLATLGLERRGREGEQLSKLSRDAQSLAVEHVKGTTAQVLKGLLFDRARCGCGPQAQEQQTPGAAATRMDV